MVVWVGVEMLFLDTSLVSHTAQDKLRPRSFVAIARKVVVVCSFSWGLRWYSVLIALLHLLQVRPYSSTSKKYFPTSFTVDIFQSVRFLSKL